MSNALTVVYLFRRVRMVYALRLSSLSIQGLSVFNKKSGNKITNNCQNNVRIVSILCVAVNLRLFYVSVPLNIHNSRLKFDPLCWFQYPFMRLKISISIRLYGSIAFSRQRSIFSNLMPVQNNLA